MNENPILVFLVVGIAADMSAALDNEHALTG
jgi:hypothetical protein